MTHFPENLEKNKKVVDLSLLFTNLNQNLFNIKKHLGLVLKKIFHVVLCILQINLYKAVSIFCPLPEWIRNIPMFYYYQDLDENLAWLTQKTEELKSNKGNFTFPTNTVHMIEQQSNKKMATHPLFLHQPSPPFTGLFYFCSKPPKWQNFRKVLHLPPL